MVIPRLVGERRALALASLGFFGSIYVIAGLAAPPEWGPMLWALAGCYGLAFMALASEWFWGRWFALGIGWSGLAMAAMSLTNGLNPILVIYGVSHGLVVLCLLGRPIAEKYELRADAGARLGLDEDGMARLGKTVTRAATALPSLLAFALAPREGREALAIASGVAGMIGLHALLRGRVWGLCALAAAATGALAIGDAGVLSSSAVPLGIGEVLPITLGVWAPRLAFAGLAFAIAPFAAPAWRYLLRSRRA